jgi:hypothetical protein
LFVLGQLGRVVGGRFDIRSVGRGRGPRHAARWRRRWRDAPAARWRRHGDGDRRRRHHARAVSPDPRSHRHGQPRHPQGPRPLPSQGPDLRALPGGPATVTAVLITASGSKKLTYSQTRKVTAGTDHLTLRPSEYGKLATRASKKVAAKLLITIKYTDKTTDTVTKSISLAAPPKKK